jgi:hypothetical protein
MARHVAEPAKKDWNRAGFVMLINDVEVPASSPKSVPAVEDDFPQSF